LSGLGHGIVHALAELLLNLSQLGSHALADRGAPHHLLSISCFCAFSFCSTLFFAMVVKVAADEQTVVTRQQMR
jgi:hypothetical protein